MTSAPGYTEATGGLKVTTKNAWFAARPSSTEIVHKTYAESFISEAHLAEVQESSVHDSARAVVPEVLQG